MKPNDISTEVGIKQFWRKVRIGTPEGCWKWLAAKDKDGYGMYKLQGRTLRAHRVVYELANGTKPEGVVMHICDNPSCCNPSHLKLGTIADNNADRGIKGRGNPLRGEAVKTSRLTVDQVVTIREAYDTGAHTIYTLAEIHRLAPQHVHNLVRGKIWISAGGPIQSQKEHLLAKLTDAQVREIRSAYGGKRGEQAVMAKKYGVTASAISQIISGKRRKPRAKPSSSAQA